MLREKFKYLRKLEALEKKGVELSKKYSMDSSLQEMMGEYETIMEEKSKQNSVKFQGNMLMAVINDKIANTSIDGDTYKNLADLFEEELSGGDKTNAANAMRRAVGREAFNLSINYGGWDSFLGFIGL